MSIIEKNSSNEVALITFLNFKNSYLVVIFRTLIVSYIPFPRWFVYTFDNKIKYIVFID